MVAKIRVLAWNIEGQTYIEGSARDAAGDISASNPSGPWSYGYSVAGGTTAYRLIPFNNNAKPRSVTSGIFWWRSDYNPSGTPSAWRNTGSVAQYGVGPGQLSLHPGPRPDGDWAILRFTAPGDAPEGEYRVIGQFFAGDRGRMNARIVRQQADGRYGFDDPIELYPSTEGNPSFNFVERLAPGEWLDFVVGNNGDFTSGNTPISVTIVPIGQMEKLANIANAIVGSRADIVLLNELCVYNWPWHGGVNQAKVLSETCGLPYYQHEMTTPLGVTGAKSVAVLSRYPLGQSIRHVVMNGANGTKYAMQETSVIVDQKTHHLLSLRLDAWNASDNAAGHHQISAWAHALPGNDVVIVGGDFNAPKTLSPGGPANSADFDTPWFDEFVRGGGLTSVLGSDTGIVDHIFFRGPYSAANPVLANPGATSDHGYVAADITAAAADFVVRFGSVVKVKHFNTGRLLHSFAANYTTGPHRQVVTCGTRYDDDDLWNVRRAFGVPDAADAFTPVNHLDIVRLQHVGTNKMLHSQAGVASPTTHQQEVSASGSADADDNWRIEVEGGGVWDGTKRVKLIHVSSGRALHSHGDRFAVLLSLHQEVTGFQDRDDNDWWSVCEIRGAPVGDGATFVEQRVPGEALVARDLAVSVKLRNTGSSTWRDASGYRLKVFPPAAWSVPAAGVNLPADVAYGQTIEIRFTVRAAQLGSQPISMRMARPDGAPFGDGSGTTNIVVKAANEDPRCGDLRRQIAGIDERLAMLRDSLDGNPRHDAPIRAQITRLTSQRDALLAQAAQWSCSL